jgi:hypothetical protein
MHVHSRHSSALPAVAAHTASSKPPLRSTALRGRKQASPNDGRRSIPAGVNGRGCAASLRGPAAAARYATVVIALRYAPKVGGLMTEFFPTKRRGPATRKNPNSRSGKAGTNCRHR